MQSCLAQQVGGIVYRKAVPAPMAIAVAWEKNALDARLAKCFK